MFIYTGGVVPGQVRITRVVLENYRSIAFCDVRLQPLSFLVGPNGAGKSNFIDALRLLSELMVNPIDTAMVKRAGFGSVLRAGAAASSRLGIRLDLSDGEDFEASYSVRLRGTADDRCIVEREECFVSNSHSFYVRNGVVDASFITSPPMRAESLYLCEASRNPLIVQVYETLCAMMFYNPSPSEIRESESTAPGLRLSPSGNNLASIVARMERQQPAALSRVLEYLQVINPQFRDVKTNMWNGSYGLLFRDQPVTDPTRFFGTASWSDGTLRSLAILTALYQSEEGPPVTLVAFEEPENSLHPAATSVLFEAMREASAQVQVLSASHSPDLLDNKEIEPESILAVRYENGCTRIGPVDQAGQSVLKRHLYTPGELLRMDQLMPAGNGELAPDAEAVLFDHAMA
jgi:predicted ATPase